MRLAHENEERYEIVIEEMGTDLDHIHLLCSAHPKNNWQARSGRDRAHLQEHHGT